MFNVGRGVSGVGWVVYSRNLAQRTVHWNGMLAFLVDSSHGKETEVNSFDCTINSLERGNSRWWWCLNKSISTLLHHPEVL